MDSSLDQHVGRSARPSLCRPARMSRSWGAPIALAVAATLALPATALAATSFTIKPHIRNHTPIINKPWPITLDVTKGTIELSGSVRYEFLFAGMVVSRQPGHRFTKGVYKDTLKFTPPSLGEHLTLRIIVTVRKYGTEHLDWKVTPKR